MFVKQKPELPKDIKDFESEYRGLTPEFLARFGSKLWFDPKSCVDRIVWPVTYNKKLLGWIAGRLDDVTVPKYRNGPERVFSAKSAMWPLDDPQVQESRTIVLVEGPFSALRLLSLGIPTVAILGAGTWDSRKLQLLLMRKLPVKKLLVAMDGDDEGWKVAHKIMTAAEGRFDQVKLFEFPEGRDPGDCSLNTIKRLRKDLLELSGDPKYETVDAKADLIQEVR